MLMLALVPQPAEAGRSCSERALGLAEMEQAIATAARLHRTLETSGAELVLLARVGSDISEYGLKYTHAGLAPRQADGSWRVTHQLNSCGSARSALYNHGLLEFMLDDPHRYDVLVARPTPALQAALIRQLDSGGPKQLHEPAYNMIAYPDGEMRFQNSNQWVLEALTQAQAGLRGETIATRHQARDFYRRQGFRGSEISIPPLQRLFGGFRANLRFDDHPDDALRRGRFEVVSVRALIDHMNRTGMLDRTLEIHAPG